ncbi:MAG: prepilin-type N-terminal cleavage/methylation domain-containing protein [Raoultibacter sp.]
MNEMIKKVRGDKKGFTLAELLIVVAIILVLVAIAIPLFVTATDTASRSVASADIRSTKSEALAMSMQPGNGDGFYAATINKDGDMTMSKAATGPTTSYTAVVGNVKAKQDVVVTVKVEGGAVKGGSSEKPDETIS